MAERDTVGVRDTRLRECSEGTPQCEWWCGSR